MTLVWDELHAMHLGVFPLYVGKVFEETIRCDVYKVGTSFNAATKKVMTVARMRGDLFAWYEKQRRENPNVPVAALTDLVPSMLHKGVFAAKAAETGSLVPFAVDLIRRHSARIPKARLLMKSGEALLTYLRITKGRQPTESASERATGWCYPCRVCNFRFIVWPLGAASQNNVRRTKGLQQQCGCRNKKLHQTNTAGRVRTCRQVELDQL